MLARDLMTREVVSVGPDTRTREIARILLDHAISAVPVIDSAGTPVGMISEGDLLARAESERDRWLALLAEGQSLSAEFLKSLRGADDTASHLMASPVVTVEESTDASEIARLLAEYRIKRVPVVREGHVVGIVSRADLLRAVVEARPAEEPRPSGGFIADAIRDIERTVGLGDGVARDDEAAASPQGGDKPRTDEKVDASAFRAMTEGARLAESERRESERRAADERRHAKLEELIGTHVEDKAWADLLRRAKQAAEKGETEFVVLQFPSELCSDGARAINVGEPDWPASLRGEAAEVYLRWERELKPHGFRLSAQVLDFPGGVPGDVALVLSWGGKRE